MCAILFAGCFSSSVILASVMGIPHEILVYLEENGMDEMMREMEFKMERPGLLKEGDRVTVTEGVLPSNYYYTIDPSLAMSGNFPFRERMLEREGVVTEVIENARGFYVRARFGE